MKNIKAFIGVTITYLLSTISTFVVCSNRCVGYLTSAFNTVMSNDRALSHMIEMGTTTALPAQSWIDFCRMNTMKNTIIVGIALCVAFTIMWIVSIHVIDKIMTKRG